MLAHLATSPTPVSLIEEGKEGGPRSIGLGRQVGSTKVNDVLLPDKRIEELDGGAEGVGAQFYPVPGPRASWTSLPEPEVVVGAGVPDGWQEVLHDKLLVLLADPQ